MIKAIGLVMIVASCSAMGISMSNEIKKRCSALKDHITAFEILKSEILFKNTPLENAIARIGESCREETVSFYSNTYKLAASGMPFASAALENYSALRRSGLVNEDIEILRCVCMSLGRYDGIAQAEALNKGIEAFVRAMEHTREDVSVRGKLSRAVCAAAGIVLALMLV